MGFAELPDHHKQAFLNRLQALGHDPSRVIGRHLNSADYDGKLIISDDLRKSAVPAGMKTVHSIAELKRLGAVPDAAVASSGDEHVQYPPELKTNGARLAERMSKTLLAGTLGENGRAAAHVAHKAYLLGNSAKVKELGWEPVIDALHFPQQVLTAAADTLIVQNGQVAMIGTLGQKTDVTFADVTIVGTGKLQFLGDVNMHVTGTFARVQG